MKVRIYIITIFLANKLKDFFLTRVNLAGQLQVGRHLSLIENLVDKKYDAFLWEFSHGGLFLASGYSENAAGFRRKFRYLGFVIILETYLLTIGIIVRKEL